MNIITDSFHALSLPSQSEVSRLLDYAKAKLLAEGIPLQLKATSYLRLCCIATEKICKIYTDFEYPTGQEDAYTSLLTKLSHYSPEWWKLCWVSDRGVLRSNDPTISQWLQPLAYLIETFTTETPASTFSTNCHTRPSYYPTRRPFAIF